MVWFFFVFNFILEGNSNLKKILRKYKFKNNLTNEEFDEVDIDMLPKNSALRIYLEFQNKESELNRIKHDLMRFTDTLKNMDIVKNAKTHYETLKKKEEESENGTTKSEIEEENENANEENEKEKDFEKKKNE